MDFSGKSVIVTGAGAGIGRAVALAFAGLGADVVVNARTPPEHDGDSTVEEIAAAGGSAVFAQGDVSDPGACADVVRSAITHFGRLDVLVNNAGVALPGTVESTSDDALDLMVDVNLKGPVYMSRAAVPALRSNGGGVIVNTGSVAALKGHRNRAVYAASKGAIVALTRSMAADHVGDGIRVNCVCPGTTLTPAIEAKIRGAADPAAAESEFVRRQPLGRLGRPDEIAGAVLYVACDEAAYMTGSVVVIDGGMTM